MKKNFAPEASAGVLTVSTKRKSRESVPTDSHDGTFADRATRLAAPIRIPDRCAFRSARDRVVRALRHRRKFSTAIHRRPPAGLRGAPAMPSRTPPGRVARRV
jgi:hypothetical protein